jgi:hypothetical protein
MQYMRLSQESYINLHVCCIWYIIFIFKYCILGLGIELVKSLRNIYQIMQYPHKGLQIRIGFRL